MRAVAIPDPTPGARAALRADLTARVTDLLSSNRVVAVGGRYTRPARRTYPHQWLWDSCFHAIVYHLLGDRALAHDELRALFRAQVSSGPDRGRLPHMTFFGGGPGEADQDPEGARAYAREVSLWGDPRASTITQPPIVAEAVLRVGDAALWRELWRPLAAYYDWWLRRRDPRGEHLYVSFHMWEIGADATPRGDAACQRLLATGRSPRQPDDASHNPTARKRADMLTARYLMHDDLRGIDGDELAGRIDEAEAQRRRLRLLGHVGVDMQAYLVRNLSDLATIGEAIGEAAAAARYRAEAAEIAAAVNRDLWDEEAGFYFDRWDEPSQVIRVRTPAPFVALYAGDLVPPGRAARLLDALADPDRFWTRWPIPTVARDEPSYDPDNYWRGSTWLNVNWFTLRGLIELHRRAEVPRALELARELARRTCELVDLAGFREYYRAGGRAADDDATTAPAGFGPDGFGWSGIVLDVFRMLDEELA
jgi:hypothetical protein